jgi:hypothetical protein
MTIECTGTEGAVMRKMQTEEVDLMFIGPCIFAIVDE